MKQIIQNYKTGELQLIEVPSPALKKGFVLVKNLASLVSVGTEKYMLEMAKKSLLGKAIARPDLVNQVIAKIKTEGVIEAYKAAMARLDTPVPLGYSSAGIVIDVGDGVEEFKRRDQVACAGSGYASHAEIVCVPKNFCVKIPKEVDFESAAFVALGAIALEAVRLAPANLGDRIAVIGLGLLGQLTVQLLWAAGCHVFAVDVIPEKLKMAMEHGAKAGAVIGRDEVMSAARHFSPKGMDATIIMAATPSNKPLELAAELTRERGRIVAAGLVGLKVPRKQFFDKELELVVSRAWGPGVFDLDYVEKGIDYPYSYARWTAKRNMEEFLAQIANSKIKVKHLITHRFPIDKAIEAYDLILKEKEPFIGVLITYPEATQDLNTISQERKIKLKSLKESTSKKAEQKVGIGVIGAGLFATSTILPILKRMKRVRFKGVATSKGISGHHICQKFGFEYFTTNYDELLSDADIQLVMIMTRHDLHARLVVEALRAGKHVYVEKPLAINLEQLQQIIQAYSQNNGQILFVGFNRRFSPFTRWLKHNFSKIKETLAVHCTVNAGQLAADHWLYDPQQGGGRIIGEVCHFVDLIQYLSNSLPGRVYAESLCCEAYRPSDNVAITLKMQNGAIGSIVYLAGGGKRYQRERVEVFGGGAVGVIENFRKAIFIQKGKQHVKRSLLSIDRGHRFQLEVLIDAILESKSPPTEIEEYIATTLATFAIEKSLTERTPQIINVDSLL